jgi:hypothetical protein
VKSLRLLCESVVEGRVFITEYCLELVSVTDMIS